LLKIVLSPNFTQN